MTTTENIETTLAYVDKSLDNVADLDADLTWTNLEVVEMLEEIRQLLITGLSWDEDALYIVEHDLGFPMGAENVEVGSQDG